jgi:hypothetical protein
MGAVWTTPTPAQKDRTPDRSNRETLASIQVASATETHAGRFLIATDNKASVPAESGPIFPQHPPIRSPDNPQPVLQAQANIGLPERFRKVFP